VSVRRGQECCAGSHGECPVEIAFCSGVRFAAYAMAKPAAVTVNASAPAAAAR